MRGASGVELFGRRMEPAPNSDDRPVGLAPSDAVFSSDIVADALCALDIKYMALRPDAAFSALHDSLVNHRGNQLPRLLPCFDCDHALDLALGYGQASGNPMVVCCDDLTASFARMRMLADKQCPVMVLTASQATGHKYLTPFKAIFQTDSDSDLNRVISEACWTSTAEPAGPVLIVLPVAQMETAVENVAQARTLRLRKPQMYSGIGSDKRDEIAAILQEANAPLILVGRMGRSQEEWSRLAAFAELHGAQVISAFGDRAAFDPAHPLHVGQIGGPGQHNAIMAFASADVVIALNWSEWGKLTTPHATRRRGFLIEVSMDWGRRGHGGTRGAQGGDLPDIVVTATPGDFLRDYPSMLGSGDVLPYFAGKVPMAAPEILPGRPVTPTDLIAALQQQLTRTPATLAHIPTSWQGPGWPVSQPMDALGTTPLGGLGVSVGAALALQGTGRLVVALIDAVNFLSDLTRLWTGAHLNLPLLIVVLNRRGIPGAADRQAELARARYREQRNAMVGTGFYSPQVGIAEVAYGFGAATSAAVTTTDQIIHSMASAIANAQQGRVAVIEVELCDAEQAEET